ncbi:putative nuclear factor related to kappa-B-binding protein [Helianthus annuus]|uniref:Nuclear factor related to kappa-B-binding protein n=1 Tax=Helianthus annuus TaxID=4232 RepID=A0A251SDP5_HELAN|nr:uncharacterized protein LOC110908091 [Helianthus annuus]KAF5821478.1 putative nuclear factor related to kappa-B-binding protein [Helianthus annuus]KAJ0611144.1 putative nuclear factor related to kappa-B-binding protein [Helianthus annuus]KAJ0782760.1 putative nuclear factor related to kappa-B-binding protein [Helianthus annuus]KAJ0947408.1 putative nuclear factor related to kappa-B-binding protein [Helianthus annuus]
MVIEKISLKVVRKPNRVESDNMSSEEDEFQKRGVALEEDGDDCDSGAGSDEFDLLELGETGEEFCQIGDQTCSVPFELYDLPGLEDVLSMDVWNDLLTDDERLNLTKYLPDMDQEHFMRTVKDLFTGSNFHFGVPMTKFYNMLKGGLCEPRVSIYRQGVGFIQKHRHYHVIRKHQNTMVNKLVQARDVWSKCRGYSIDEKIRVLHIMKSQKSLMNENTEELETDSSEESADGLWSNKTLKEYKPKGKQNLKGTQKVSGSKTFTTEERVNPFSSLEVKHGPSSSSSLLSRQMRDHEENAMYDVTVHGEHNLTDRVGKKHKGYIGEEFQETFMGVPVPLKTDMHAFGRNRVVNQLSDIKVLTAKPSGSRFPYDYGKKVNRPEYNQKIDVEGALNYRNPHDLNQQDPFWHQSRGDSIDLYRMGMKKGKTVNTQNGGRVVAAAEGMKMLAKGEETESDSSEQFGEDDDDNPLMRSKWAYPSGVKSRPDFKKQKLGGKNNNKSFKNMNGDVRFEDIFVRKTYPDGSLQKKGKTHGNNLFNDLNSDARFEDFLVRKPYPGGKKRKGEFGNDHSTLPSMHINDYHEMVDIRLSGGNSGSKKRKAKDELMYMDDHDQEGQSQFNDVYVRTVGKRKWADDIPFENVIPEPTVMEIAEEEADFENKTQKKPFILITPTVHTGFSFSIIHLLSAVRMAMVTLLPEDNVNDEVKPEAGNGDHNVDPTVPSLTVKDIVNRVQSNPGDPCILETQEPLQDLVRGVLKIFSSKTSPLGAKGWKPLVLYKKPVKSWSWVGPVSRVSSDHENVEEVTSPESWGLPHKTLVKLVDSFANWLKSGQETLQQIGSLPPPPLTLMQVNLDEKERFRDLRAQKSLNTINPSSEEVRDYFRKEEVLRYLIPDRVFAYTTVDGKKSTVAPSRKGAGKPTSKARDHFMLKRDRPPHVTILCLVRDAAARLPGSIGTRADVCTLIRDSQYIVEEVSDAQVNQVVSGALDRLHYERDPCVQFDGERKLWVYLHREREEEDFDDDGTSSTKKWKRQKKEAVEPSDQGGDGGGGGGAVTLAYHGTGEPTGFDLSIEPEPSSVNNDQDFDDGREEDVVEVCVS